jgi:hypothetical protein
MSVPAFAGGASIAVLAAVVLAAAVPTAARAEACSNAQFRSGASERLPDCRVFEQVSPPEKGGLDAVTLEPMQPAQSSACGPGEACTIAYMNVGSSFAGAPGNEIANAYVSSRGAGGWLTTPLSPPTPQAPPDSLPRVTYAFSADLSQAVLRVPEQQLTQDAPPNVYNLFLRDGAGEYSLVTTSAPPEPPVSGCGSCFEEQDVPMFAGASGDFSRIFFEANDGLEGAPSGEVVEPDGEEREIENLYEATGGNVRPVGVLPDGVIAPHGASAGGTIRVIGEQAGELERAISRDGSRVLFAADADGGGPEPAQAGKLELYDRLDGTTTAEVSAPAPGARPGDCETEAGECHPGAAELWSASTDGSVVYFTSKAALTRQSYTGPEPNTGPEPPEPPGNDLYRYDVETGALADLTTDAEPATDGASVLGVLGASEDGSYVYFVAKGVLSAQENGQGKTAQPGLPNLYVWHETTEGAGTVAFIATLAAPEASEEVDIQDQRTGVGITYRSDILDWSSDPRASQAYVTPDGRHLAFMSVEPLTGYDNRQAVLEDGERTQVADHEVFEYSAETGGLVCASCDPGGAEPLGSAFIGASLSERASTPFHQPRSVSDDGSRLFFTSPDPLVPGVAGGADKVFEYEDGAPQLISGTQPGGVDVFLDASASGDDVFLATRERLAPTDADELVDVYDARVDGGLPLSAPPVGCQPSGCQRSPEPAPTFAVPASASFTGLGNFPPPSTAKPSRKQELARALARCRKLKAHRKRAACVGLAERRYGPRNAHRGVPGSRPVRR